MSLHVMYAEQAIAAMRNDLLEAHKRNAELEKRNERLEDLCERLERCRWRRCATCELVYECDFEREFDELGLDYDED